MIRSMTSAAILAASCLLAAPAQAGYSVVFNPDTNPDGIGTGTLTTPSLSSNVTYNTAAAASGNSGRNYTNGEVSFATSAGTAGGFAAVGGLSSTSAGVLGVQGNATQTDVINFTVPVTNAVLFLNYTDADTTFNFGALPFTVLSSNHAQVNGSTVSFLGATNSADDGIVIQFIGTYANLNFTETEIGGFSQSQAFTIALSSAVPEPSSVVLIGLGLAAVGVAGLARRRVVAAA